jgi:hypothetical protein
MLMIAFFPFKIKTRYIMQLNLLKTFEIANTTHIHEVRINTDSVKSLGIFIGHNKISCNEKKMSK